MIDKETAQSIVLQFCQDNALDSNQDLFVIQSCELSPNRDYWVICCNTEDYVVRGVIEHCYVGVSAYLVDTTSGAIEKVGSAQNWRQYLQDKYNLQPVGES